MGLIIGIIIFGIPSALIAGSKGFKSMRWLLAFGLIGLIVVSTMKSAKAKTISNEESYHRAAKADTVGAWMCGLNVSLVALSFLILLASF